MLYGGKEKGKQLEEAATVKVRHREIPPSLISGSYHPTPLPGSPPYVWGFISPLHPEFAQSFLVNSKKRECVAAWRSKIKEESQEEARLKRQDQVQSSLKKQGQLKTRLKKQSEVEARKYRVSWRDQRLQCDVVRILADGDDGGC